MLLLPVPDAEGIAKTKEIVFNRSGCALSDEEASRLLGGLMSYLYLLRRLDEQARDAKGGTTKDGGAKVSNATGDALDDALQKKLSRHPLPKASANRASHR